MKAWEMMLLVYQIMRAKGRVKCLLLLGLRASPLHNMVNTDWESKFPPGLGVVNVPCSTASLAPWWFHTVAFPCYTLFLAGDVCELQIWHRKKDEFSPLWGNTSLGFCGSFVPHRESREIEDPSLGVFGYGIMNIFNNHTLTTHNLQGIFLSLFNTSKVDTHCWILGILMNMSTDCLQTCKHWMNFRLF